jgi:hypothetical protein
VPSDPWSALRGQIYLGSDAFVEDVRGRAAQRTRAPEIPRPQRETTPPAVEQVLPVIFDVLATTGSELACYPRKRGRERAILAYALRQVAGASGTTIAQVLGVSAWRACALARAGERHCRGDAHLGLVVKATAVDAKQQT